MALLSFNIKSVNTEIERACQLSSRSHRQVTLIAVSKGHDFLAVKKAYDAGLRHFGESYAQEMANKIRLAEQHKLDDIVWHFIGAIQTNKLKDIIKADMIHSLSSIRHANALSQALKKIMPIFIQINLDNNPRRQGILQEDVQATALAIQAMPNLALIGLMCIPPQDGKHPPQFWFERMNNLKDMLTRDGFTNLKLSMGMSDDFSEAIAMGADYVRIGTRIFGARNTN